MFFFNVGASGFDGIPMKVATRAPFNYQPIIGFEFDPFSPSGARPVFGPELTVTGFRLQDGRASYGIGLETFALGFPIHFDWSWRTLFNKDWEDLVFFLQGGSAEFRKPRFSMWIGYDF